MSPKGIKRLNWFRRLARPTTTWMLIFMIGPLAIATGLVEAYWPGAGVSFALGFGAFLKAYPETFWMFAAGVLGVTIWSRSNSKDKEREIEELDHAYEVEERERLE